LGQTRIDARALEQNAAQLRGESAGELTAQQPVARDVLVDFGLHFQLEYRHRTIMAGVPGEIEEVAHAFERVAVFPTGPGRGKGRSRLHRRRPPAARRSGPPRWSGCGPLPAATCDR